MLDFKTHYVLTEGGVAGHMSHVYENIELTVAQLKALFKDLIQGRKENITEKVDGQNIFFTWDDISHTVRFARNSTEYKNGGLTYEGMKEKFKNHPETVKAAFYDGGSVIQTTLLELNPDIRSKVFGKTGSFWINAEIMHTRNPNLIQYSGNYIVMHGMSSNTNEVPPSENFKILTKYLDEQTARQSQHIWSVVGPRLVKIENFSDINGPYNSFCKTIDNIFSAYKLNNSSTISDYIVAAVTKELQGIHMPLPAIDEVTAAIVGKKKVNIPFLKKHYGSAFAPIITQYATQTNIASVRDRVTKPIQEAITDLSIEVLKTLSSFFVNNHTKEIERVRQELRNAIIAIEQTKDEFYEERVKLLNAQMSKLKQVENFCSTIEGIVFEEPPGSGQLYKLTGAYAPVNQILGLVTYGRGTVPPLKQK